MQKYCSTEEVPALKITWDKEAQAVYIYLLSEDEKVVETYEAEGHDWCSLDYNKDGKLVGIEILHVEEAPILEVEA